MEHNKIAKVNIVYFATIMLYIIVSFMELPFIKEQYLLMVTSQIILFLPAGIYLAVEKVPLKKALRINRIKNVNMFLLIILAFTVSPVLNFINSLSMIFAENRTSTKIIGVVADSPLILSVIIIALIPAVFEEAAYRGIYYNSYKESGILKAVLLSSVLFASLHGNLNQFSYAAVVGILLALVVEATGSIISSIIIHFIINISSVIQIYLLPILLMLLEYTYYDAIDSGNNELAALVESFVGGTDFSLDSMIEQSVNVSEKLTFSDVVSNYLFGAVIGGLLSYLIFKKIAKNEGRWEHIKNIFSRKAQEDEEGHKTASWKEMLTMPLIAAIVIMAIFMIVLEFI